MEKENKVDLHQQLICVKIGNDSFKPEKNKEMEPVSVTLNPEGFASPDLDEFDLNGKRSWLVNMWNMYPKSHLVNVALQYTNQGMVSMKLLALKNILKDHYHIEPDEQSWIMGMIFMPNFFQALFGLFVDAKIVSKRKYYFIVFALISSVSEFIISMNWITNAKVLFWILFIDIFGATFCDATINSLIV